jgi:CRISPR-associated endonuclease/helicase Cas3
VVTQPWGKSAPHTRHHLAHHCADVVACFIQLVETSAIRSRLETAAGRPLSAIDIDRLAVLVFLHDAGKLHPGFQAKGWPTVPSGLYLRGHVSEGLAALWCGDPRKPGKRVRDGQIAEAMHVPALAQWCNGMPEPLLRATIGHHGRPFSVDHQASMGWDAVPLVDYDPLAAARSIGALLPCWFPKAFEKGGLCLPQTPRFLHLFCGITTLVDWLGSNRDVFQFVGNLDSEYFSTMAMPRAARAIAGTQLDTGLLRRAMADVNDFRCIAPGRQPRAAQEAIAIWPTDDPLLILEAETGAGKTEAALWRFAKLFEAGTVDSLYFAVPTRAAAKQLHRRVGQAMLALFGEQAPEPVLAIPGYMRAGDATGLLVEHRNVIWDDQPRDGQLSEGQLLGRWAAENAKRFLAAPIAVGTVDQAMLAALQVKHAHLRAASLARSLLVIDEVHASDRYMTQILRTLLDAHLGWGGHVLLMSATLGSAARVRWLEKRRPQLPDLGAASADAYPSLCSARVRTPQAIVGAGREKRVTVVSHQGWTGDDAATLAITTANAGARVLVIRNTVAAAIETLDAVERQGASAMLWHVAGRPALHHSRFAAEDRALLDREVEIALAPRPKDAPLGPGVIIIGTQTLEQSLDIDADILITDLCPMDVLLQRIGRLHRHDGSRPDGFETAQCVVLSPAAGLDGLAAPRFENGLGAFSSKGGGMEGVYLNLPSCALTLKQVEDHLAWEIPAMNRKLVESATHDDAIEAFVTDKGPIWTAYWQQYTGRSMADKAAATHVVLPFDEPLVDEEGNPLLFLGDDQSLRTRLGAEGAIVNFSGFPTGPFGTKISRITLPAHWSRHLNPEEELISLTKFEKCNFSFQVGDAVFAYGSRGLEKSRT